MFAQIVVLSLSLFLSILFFLYGFNYYYLLWAASRYKSPILVEDASRPRPSVSIHLPVYNEKYVIRRLLAATVCMAEDYGIDHVKILILDDSNDDTIEEIDEVVKYYQEKHVQIKVLRRENRQGFKAGALQTALFQTEEEFIAIFDADFIPSADFLSRTVPFFLQDEHLGIIQTRWTHINRNYNTITRAIAVGIDVHFFIEQAGRYAAGCFQNFNGSGGVLRKKAMQEAGGWQSDTLAEDLDLSYRIQFQGYHCLYLNDVLSPGEIPPTVPSFRKQQARWANGSLRVAKKTLPTILSNRQIGFKKRWQAFIHLTGYMVHPLMFSSFVVVCLATLLGVDAFRLPQTSQIFQGEPQTILTTPDVLLQNMIWVSLGILIVLCTISVWVAQIVVIRAQNLPILRNLWIFPILFFLGFGISLNNTIEAGKALLTNRHWAFVRTPKYAIQHRKENWRRMKYQVPLDFVAFLELAFIILGGFAIGDAIHRSNLGALLILIPYTFAYTFVLHLTFLQSRGKKVQQVS